MTPPRPPSLRTLLLVLLTIGFGARRASAEGALVDLEGVKAVVRAPEGWERAAVTPAAGEWRVVFRGPKLAQGGAQCEARVFPVQGTQEAVSVLLQAADQVARTVGGEGPGLGLVTALRLEGRPAAQAHLVVQAGTLRLEGGIRILRAAGTAWALAWGLAPADAPAAVREVARSFASSLTPSEPAFYEPAPPPGDPEEALVSPAGEEPLRRRHVEAVLGCLEAGAGLRLPQNARSEVLAVLRTDALEGGAATRKGYRDTQRALHEASGKPAEEQLALRAGLGQALLKNLQERQGSGYAPAQRLALILALGARPGMGNTEDGPTRFEVEIVIEGLAFLASFAADRALEPDAAQRAGLREAFSKRWAVLDPEGRADLERLATAGPDLLAAWGKATPDQRFALRSGVAALLLLPRAVPGSAPPAPPADLKALRACLDASTRSPEQLFEGLVNAAPGDLVRLTALLPSQPPAK